MTTLLDYLEFLKLKGKPLSEINPGSNEFALSVNDVLEAIEILKENEVLILGGDILSINNFGELIYAYQIWGDGQEYHYLNWSCKRNDSPQKSYEIAKKAIKEADKVSNKLGKDCLVVIVW